MQLAAKRKVLVYLLCLTYLFVLPNIFAENLTAEAEIKNQYLWLKVDPSQQGVISQLGLTNPPDNISGPLGMFQEGFGVGSFYVPNRKINEQWESISAPDGTKIIYTYDCEGPNIQGLKVKKTMQLLPNEAGLLIKMDVKNEGKETQWIAPWVANSINPGGKWNETDRLELPTTEGIISMDSSRHLLAARNWAAYTDPQLLENVCLIFHADMLHSFLAVWETKENKQGVQSWFIPTLLKVGDTWSTTYKLSIVRGLSHVNFATDEMACQLDYNDDGKLILLLSPNREFNNMQIKSRVLAADGRVWRLPTKKFDFQPNILIRCTYEWKAPGPGRYDFLSQLEQDGKPYYLGKETGSPHGGIDTQFVVGNPENLSPSDEEPFPPWTDAPKALDKGPRKLVRNLIFRKSNIKVWMEPSLFKIFPDDDPEPSAQDNTSFGISLARRERESFQIALRNNGTEICSAQLLLSELKNKATGVSFPKDVISIYEEKYHHVIIPSYYEGPTGYWPDSLKPTTTLKILPKTTSAFWLTFYAPESLPPGDYEGTLELQGSNFDPIEIELNIHVFEFALPDTPTLKTDFGFSWENALKSAQILSGNKPNASAVASLYLENAIEHRVTLRELTQLPLPQTSNYEQELSNILPKIQRLQKEGIINFTIPPKLIEQPEQLKVLYSFLQNNNLLKHIFVPLWEYPEERDKEKLTNLTAQWKLLAPELPLMTTTRGLNPILPENVDIWCIHSPVMDTPYNKYILEQIQKGKEVWWCVNHAPPRPYANFFLDFAGIEHRILFWQTWMLGIKGMHYWCINYSKEKNPEACPLDVIPTNGDGFLVYPGLDKPINSIRWEIIRDGIEDYDYLSIFYQLLKELKDNGSNPELLQRAEKIYDFKEFCPDLVNFSRNHDLLLSKRIEIGKCIEEMLKTRQNRKATASPVPAIKTTIPSETIFPVKPQETPKITPPQKREDLPQQVVKPPQKKSIQTNPTLNPKSVGFNKKAND
ncbi:MAG TPA: DUF4091 domain-containing protein [Candidatus Hydrogenedens sp.]|nr:DUF4091 domain-containing protein [Candidatus Hydrogenedens sp.]